MSGSPPRETYYNGMMRQGINQLGTAHMAAASINSVFRGAGGTGIAPAPCGCGARGALSRLVYGCLNGPSFRGFAHPIVQGRPSTSSQYVVSFVVRTRSRRRLTAIARAPFTSTSSRVQVKET